MKIARKRGSTSNWIRVKLKQDGSAAAGSQGKGKTGLTISSTGLIISTIADNEATATAYTAAGSTIETITTLGTFATPTANKCRFKEVDATNHPGWYEIQLADARFAVSSSKSLGVTISGVSGVLDCDVEIQLTAVDVDSAATFMTGVNGLAPPTRWNLLSIDLSGRTDLGAISGSTTATSLGSNQLLPVDAKYVNGTALTARDIGASVLISAGTGTGQLDVTSGVIKANLVQILATVLTETAGQIAAAFKKFFNIGAPAATMDHGVLVDTLTTYTGNTLQTGDAYAVVNDAAFGNSRLVRSTTPANTLDVSATGEAGLDFNNVKDATGAHTLANIRVPNVTLADTVTTYTGNTLQTGDSFLRLGAPAGASMSADVAAVKTDTSTLTGRITSTLFAGITAFKNWLGTLAGKTADATTLAEINATTAGAGFNNTTDALEALRDRGDVAWNTPATVTLAAGSIASSTFAAGAINIAVAPNLDAAVSSRLASGSYTAPDNADALIAATNTAALIQMTTGTGTARLFVANALSNAPAGGGGGGGGSNVNVIQWGGVPVAPAPPGSTPVVIPTAMTDNQVAGYLYFRDGHGGTAAGMCSFELIATSNVANAECFPRQAFTEMAGSNGALVPLFEQNSYYQGRRVEDDGTLGPFVPFVTPTNNTTFALPLILGASSR